MLPMPTNNRMAHDTQNQGVQAKRIRVKPKIRIAPSSSRCWQSAQVGQIRTREDHYYEELRGSSLRVLL